MLTSSNLYRLMLRSQWTTNVCLRRQCMLELRYVVFSLPRRKKSFLSLAVWGERGLLFLYLIRTPEIQTQRLDWKLLISSIGSKHRCDYSYRACLFGTTSVLTRAWEPHFNIHCIFALIFCSKKSSILLSKWWLTLVSWLCAFLLARSVPFFSGLWWVSLATILCLRKVSLANIQVWVLCFVECSVQAFHEVE